MFSLSPDIYTLSLHDALPILIAAVEDRLIVIAALDKAAIDLGFIDDRAIDHGGVDDFPVDHRRVDDLLVDFGFIDDSGDRKSTRLNSSHLGISYAVFCLKKKT